MNLHEYQGKEILASYGVSTQKGIVVSNAKDAFTAAQKLNKETGTNIYVVKAQIHAGGRGKGGGVKIGKSLDEVKQIAEKMIGMMLITPQTPAEGKKVRKILIAEDVYYQGESETKEFYMSILLDRKNCKNIIMYSTEGGMDIEKVAETKPELIFKETVNPTIGLQKYQARQIAFNLGLKGDAFKDMTKFIFSLYKAYVKSDSSLFEINPLLKTSDDRIIVVDSKVTIDNNALFRHPDYLDLRDLTEESPTEVEADKAGLNYIDLEGNVGCMVNGAGLAMATMDLIKQAGGSPSNFLDVGGTADAQRVEKGFRIILKDPSVKAILINIFGGIVRCDRVANGIVEAYKNIESINIPIIVRLQGTNSDIAKEIIDNSNLNVLSATDFKEAADKVQEVIK